MFGVINLFMSCLIDCDIVIGKLQFLIFYFIFIDKFIFLLTCIFIFLVTPMPDNLQQFFKGLNITADQKKIFKKAFHTYYDAVQELLQSEHTVRILHRCALNPKLFF